MNSEYKLPVPLTLCKFVYINITENAEFAARKPVKGIS